MGWLKEKYTREYFTGQDAEGTKLEYGVDGHFEGKDTTLREFDLILLSRINFSGANVLEIGFGRGESIKYSMEQGAKSYVGVDFAEPAYDLASEFVRANNYTTPKLYCADALEFLKNKQHDFSTKVDVVVMLDVLEHIPRHELKEIFILLRSIMSEKAVLVLNTPLYRFDNDVIAEGLDKRNHVGAVDHTDFIEETAGMHCNKYSRVSLPEFLALCGYTALTQSQIYIPRIKDEASPYPSLCSYAQAWKDAHSAGYPIIANYTHDEVELAYQLEPNEEVTVQTCTDAPLKGVRVIANKDVFNGYLEDLSVSVIDENLHQGDIVFDVGGFVGLSSLHFSKLIGPSGKVYCFEPNPANISRMRTNLSENVSFAKNVVLYPFGLGSESGTKELLLSDCIELGYSSTSQLIKGGRTANPHQRLIELGFYKKNIQVERLDVFVERTGIVPQMIKVDIEGAEVVFLNGALETLKKHKPVLFIELHSPLAVYYVLQTLRLLGYDSQVISEESDNRIQIIAKHNPEASVPSPTYLSSEATKLLDLHDVQSLKTRLDNERAYNAELQGALKEKQRAYGQLEKEHQAVLEKMQSLSITSALNFSKRVVKALLQIFKQKTQSILSKITSS